VVAAARTRRLPLSIPTEVEEEAGAGVTGLAEGHRISVEATDYPREVAEMSLAHAIGSAVEAAYRRGDLFDKRRALMADWAEFCGKGAG
jgi:hypothetical protein